MELNIKLMIQNKDFYKEIKNIVLYHLVLKLNIISK